MIAALSGLTSRAGTSRTRDEILQAHARHESRQQAQTPTKPYRDLLPIVYKRLAEEWGVSVTNAECEDYGRSVRDWPEFIDSPGALRYLKKFYKMIILISEERRVGQECVSTGRARWTPCCSKTKLQKKRTKVFL